MREDRSPVGQRRSVKVHGRSVSYVQAGAGPVLLLIHGIAGSLRTWTEVVEPLSRVGTVIAVDLPGHGRSEAAGGDYSLGTLAAGLRDLLVTLGHDRATLVGHSLGGGIALQFAYQFPAMTERLVLVSSGGLGHEVHPVLRAAAVPGSEPFVRLTAHATRALAGAAGRARLPSRVRLPPGVTGTVRAYGSLADAGRRAAFLGSVKSVVDVRGQNVQAADRLYLLADVPILIVWGAADPIIPVRHAVAAHEAMDHSTLCVLDGVGHVVPAEAPDRLTAAVAGFCATTAPAAYDGDRWRTRLRPVT